MTELELIQRDQLHQGEYFGAWIGWSIVGAVMLVVLLKAISSYRDPPQ